MNRTLATIRYYRGFRSGNKLGIRFGRIESAKAAIRFIQGV